MIAVSVVLVGVVASIIIGVLLAVLAYLFARLARATKRSLGGLVASRWLTWLGVAISVVGIVLAVWLQLILPRYPGPDSFDVTQRLQYASLGLGLIASGALLSVAAQIMGMMQAARSRESN